MSYIGSSEIGKVREGTGYIKRIYLGSELVFKYTNPVTYHIDTGNSYTEDVEYDASCLSPSKGTPTKTGYTFFGWATSSTAVSESDKLSTKKMGHNAIDLYAIFKKEYKLSYANGGGTGTMTADTITQYYNHGKYSTGDDKGVTFTLKANGFSRTDYTFNGWSISSTTKNPGDPITLSGDATATALWKVNFTTIDSRDYRLYDKERDGYWFDIHGYGNGVAPNHWWDTENSYKNGEPVESNHGDVFNGDIHGSSDPNKNLTNFTKFNLVGSKSITLTIYDFHSAESIYYAGNKKKGSNARIYFDNVLVIDANTHHFKEGTCPICKNDTELKKTHLKYEITIEGEAYQNLLNQVSDKTKVTIQHCHYYMDGDCEAARCILVIK